MQAHGILKNLHEENKRIDGLLIYLRLLNSC